MRQHQWMLPSMQRRLVLLAFAAMSWDMPPLYAQPPGGDPAQEIRLILKAPFRDLGARDRLLKAQIEALDGVGDLARALVLREWRDQDQDHRVAAIDLPNRIALAGRFEHAVREVLHQGDNSSRLAVLSLLAEMGTKTHGVGTKHGIARGFGPDLLQLVRSRETQLSATALRTLGQIDPGADVALTAFSAVLSAEDPNLRLAAADGLVCWIRWQAQLATRSSEPDGVEVSWSMFVATGQAIVHLAARGLAAEQPEIRRRCAQAIGYVATALHTRLLATRSFEASEDPDSFQRCAEQLVPLMLVLKDEGPALLHALADADGEVRYRIGWVLEDLVLPRELLLPLAQRPPGDRTNSASGEIIRPSSFSAAVSLTDDPEAVQGTVQVLAVQLSSADLEARRSAMDNLENLGQDASSAIPALVGALNDPDKFVRWGATRILGKFGPAAGEVVALRLALLLTDSDLDVRLAAVAALERLGPAAQPATADLCRTLSSTDAELRLAALRALRTIGDPDEHEAIAEVSLALRDPDFRVRLTAAQVLGKFGPAAREAVPTLCQFLQDSNFELQRAASEALLNILRPGKK